MPIPSPVLERAQPGDLPGDWVNFHPRYVSKNQISFLRKARPGAKSYPRCQNSGPWRVEFVERLTRKAPLSKRLWGIQIQHSFSTHVQWANRNRHKTKNNPAQLVPTISDPKRSTRLRTQPLQSVSLPRCHGGRMDNSHGKIMAKSCCNPTDPAGPKDTTRHQKQCKSPASNFPAPQRRVPCVREEIFTNDLAAP
ncbi:hypothetical protein BKA80DRAFT_100741 [Phyllosticta citrichinensis]